MPRLWERDRLAGDLLHLRLGLGEVTSQVTAPVAHGSGEELDPRMFVVLGNHELELPQRSQSVVLERRIQEGDPDGIEGGVREASEGDLYAGRLSTFFRRGWSYPATISREDMQGLTTMVSVEIGDDLKIHGFRIVRPSGNADFDLTVSAQLQRLVDSQATIPPPPEEPDIPDPGDPPEPPEPPEPVEPVDPTNPESWEECVSPVVYQFLEAPDEPVVATFTAADVSALEAELGAVIARIREGDFRPTPSDFACAATSLKIRAPTTPIVRVGTSSSSEA